MEDIKDGSTQAELRHLGRVLRAGEGGTPNFFKIIPAI